MPKQKNKQKVIYHPLEPWDNNSNDVWLASTLKFYRNIAKYKFPGKLSSARRKQVLSLLEGQLKSSPLLKKPMFLDGKDLPPLQKEFLFEHFLASDSFQNALVGEGFVVDATGEFLAVINMRDHLQLQLTDISGELENKLAYLTNIETEIGKSVAFSFSPQFGFLSPDLWHSGTGLFTSLFLHLPALIYSEKIWDTLEKSNKDNLIIGTGMQGDAEDLIGDILVLQNQQMTGVTEGDIIGNMRACATKLVVAERGLRAKYKRKCPDDIHDLVNRAFGLLKHSYQLETVETWDALSSCKLGLDIGLIKGVDHTSLNTLWFNCRRVHFIELYEEKLSSDELAAKRAEYVHAALEGIKLA
jgi:protein arginine kinase